MPYKRIGRLIYHLKNGKWSLKQEASSVENAKKAFALLEGLAHGSIKQSEVGKGKYKHK